MMAKDLKQYYASMSFMVQEFCYVHTFILQRGGVRQGGGEGRGRPITRVFRASAMIQIFFINITPHNSIDWPTWMEITLKDINNNIMFF